MNANVYLRELPASLFDGLNIRRLVLSGNGHLVKAGLRLVPGVFSGMASVFDPGRYKGTEPAKIDMARPAEWGVDENGM